MELAHPVNTRSRPASLSWIAWGLPLFGLAQLYIPTYIGLYKEYWVNGNTGAPVMLLLVCWLLWRQRTSIALDAPRGVGQIPGIGLVLAGCVLYYLGRAQTFYQLEVVSQVPLILGCITVLSGTKGLKSVAFPVCLLLCLVPVPGSVIDEILLPLKEWVSDVVDNVLHLAGYPIGRTGVIITIGPYNLLVADACSGLHSITALLGAGLVYSYLSVSSRYWARVLLLLSIIPVALFTNVLRVLGLTLTTYYFGERVGNQFHNLAGYLEMALAFASLYGIERGLLHWQRRRSMPLGGHT
jgi:exosortase